MIRPSRGPVRHQKAAPGRTFASRRRRSIEAPPQPSQIPVTPEALMVPVIVQIKAAVQAYAERRVLGHVIVRGAQGPGGQHRRLRHGLPGQHHRHRRCSQDRGGPRRGLLGYAVGARRLPVDLGIAGPGRWCAGGPGGQTAHFLDRDHRFRRGQRAVRIGAEPALARRRPHAARCGRGASGSYVPGTAQCGVQRR